MGGFNIPILAHQWSHMAGLAGEKSRVKKGNQSFEYAPASTAFNVGILDA